MDCRSRSLRMLMFTTLALAGCGPTTEPATASVDGVWRITFGPLSGGGLTCGSTNAGIALIQTGDTFGGGAGTITVACDGPQVQSRFIVNDPTVLNGVVSGKSISFDLAD